jgi:hypothetical protein
MASKGKKVDFNEEPAKVRSTALGAFERTHGRTQQHGRTHALTHARTHGRAQNQGTRRTQQPALAVICVRTQSTYVRTHFHVSPSRHSSYLRSNVPCVRSQITGAFERYFERTSVSCQPINRPRVHSFVKHVLGGASRAQALCFSL